MRKVYPVPLLCLAGAAVNMAPPAPVQRPGCPGTPAYSAYFYRSP
jgi:hypothetical protein